VVVTDHYGAVDAQVTEMKNEKGFTLLETLVALALLLVVAAGVLPLGILAFSTSENQGHLASRAAEYAQDKMEQLLALSYGDSSSDTRVFPALEVGGTGLTIGGSSNPVTPEVKYVDYLDRDGVLLLSPTGTAPPAGWYYKRTWEITSPRANLKQITVTATVQRSAGAWMLNPTATVTALKTFPF
jgi:prepilin-type N-terminal cleavage/methylation domain-containing protein